MFGIIFPATSFQNLETELNGLRSTVYNLNSILVELNNVCDDSIIYELEKDIQELNQRYGSIGQKIKKHKAQNEEMISAFEAFNKDCTEMLAWLQCQNDVLDRENEEPEPPLLASELAQLKQCEVSSKDRKPQFVLANKSRLNEDHKINASREKHTNVCNNCFGFSVKGIAEGGGQTTRVFGSCQKSRSGIEIKNKTRQPLCVPKTGKT